MGVRGTIVGVGAAFVLVLAGLGLPQAAADNGPKKLLTPDTSIPAGMSVAELATSDERLTLLDDLRDAAVAKPQRYGGVATWGDANITLCDNGSGADPATDAPVNALRATGSTVTIKRCAHNLNDLNKVLAEVDPSTVFSLNSVTLRRLGIDYRKNAVEIGVDRIPAGFADKVTALWGDAAYLWVSPEMHLLSRTNDTSPFYGTASRTANAASAAES